MKKIDLENRLVFDSRFTLHQISIDEWGSVLYFEPIIHFDDLIEYDSIVKNKFSNTNKYLSLCEYTNNPDEYSSEYFNRLVYMLDDSKNALANINLAKLNNTLKSLF